MVYEFPLILKEPTLADERGDEGQPALWTDDDILEQAQCSVPESVGAPEKRRAWYRWILSASMSAAALSLALHALAGVGVWWVWQKSHDIAPARGDFAYGNASPESGLKDREGQAELSPGWAGVGPAVPSPSIPATPAVAQAADSEESSAVPIAAPAPVVVAPEPPELLIGLSMQSPDLPHTLTVNPQTSVKRRLLESLEAEAKAAAMQDAVATQAFTPALAATPVGGDQSVNGQGGASTGSGGTAATGQPGIPAGLRDGQHLIKPRYPALSFQRGEEGRVLLAVEVMMDGRVGTVSILEDAGHPKLARAAAESLQGQVFRPALEAGKPVRSVLPIPYNFRIEKSAE